MSQASAVSLEQELGHYIGSQRWFAGKGRDHVVETIRTAAWLGAPGADPRVAVSLVDVASIDETGYPVASSVYQVPLAYRRERQEQLDGAYLGVHEGPDGAAHVYDAVHDRAAVSLLVRVLLEGGIERPLASTVVANVDADLAGPSVVLSGEQSNTNIVVGDHLLLKIFRRVEPGLNPDIEVLSALTRAGSRVVVPLIGWLELAGPDDKEPIDLAMVSEFLRMATDGWGLALTSVRDLFAERDLHPEEVGGDFAAESHRLGATTAHLHAELARHLPTAWWGADETTALAARMRARLDAAVDEVPDLAEHADGLAALIDRLGAWTGRIRVQRVHGDLHLGQTLRTYQGWVIIDFEGEPERPLADRTALDSPVRDVAGMLRSFDYAAQSQWMDLLGDHQLAARAIEWAQRNRDAFLAGYAEESGDDPRDTGDLLLAYEADKAIYEVVYEARNRPGWSRIPLRAVARLTGADATTGGHR